MANKRLKLTPEEAKVILRTDDNNADATTKRLLQKVVDQRPLSDEERSALEGIVSNQKLLQQFGQLAADITDPENTAGTIAAALLDAERTIELEDRRNVVMALRCQHPPVSIRNIAKRLNVCVSTIVNDIRRTKDRYGRIMGDKSTLEIVGKTAAQYDVIHGKAMAWADDFTSPMAKAAFLRTAVSAMDSKTRLLEDTGVIHRVAQKMDINIGHAGEGTVMERAAILINAQEQRTSPTLELPAPDPEATEEEDEEEVDIFDEQPKEATGE